MANITILEEKSTMKVSSCNVGKLEVNTGCIIVQGAE